MPLLHPSITPCLIGNPPPLYWRIPAAFTTSTVSFLSMLAIKLYTRTTVYNRDTFVGAVLNREKGRGLITVSNHAATIDDPLLWGLMPPSILFQPSRIRWSTGAREICHSSTSKALFFSLGQVIPIVRGAGIYQVGMDCALEKLNQGHWVHIFPEGKVNQSPDMLRFKWGLGRLILESRTPPLILPLYHDGLSSVMPLDKAWIPRPFKKLTVTFGDLIDSSVWIKESEQMEIGWKERRSWVTRCAQDELEKLKKWTLDKIQEDGGDRR
ncbi:Tafazzin-like protein [Paraphysoderma sedebokerense]|nr:Tafazzin-like protein [Paraphysoderma sedebokerense]